MKQEKCFDASFFLQANPLLPRGMPPSNIGDEIGITKHAVVNQTVTVLDKPHQSLIRFPHRVFGISDIT